MKDHILFDSTDADTIAASDRIFSGILSTDGSTLITDTLEGGKQGLDVYVINTNLSTADAANKAEDAAHVSGDTGNFVLAVANHTEGALHSADGDYAALQVDSSGRLRVISDLDYIDGGNKNEDDAHVSGDEGKYVLAVRQDTLATDTSADGDYASFKVNATGELYTTDEGAEALLTTIDADTGAILTEIQSLTHNEDDAHTTGDAGMMSLAVRNDTKGALAGTDGDYIPFQMNSVGELYVTDEDAEALLTTIDADTGNIDTKLGNLSHLEDTAHTTGDTGIMPLAVRNDTLSALAGADGDYIPLTTNASGELYVTIGSEINVDDTANTAIANAVNTMTAANTAEDVVASPLADRKYLFIYNNKNKQVYIGASGVSAANGFPLSPGSVLEMRVGAAVDVEWVAADTTQEIRTLELS